jgi:hypothetical protein
MTQIPDPEKEKKREAATCSRRQFLQGGTAAAAIATTLGAESRGTSAARDRQVPNLYFGDIHCHSNRSDGNGEVSTTVPSSRFIRSVRLPVDGGSAV